MAAATKVALELKHPPKPADRKQPRPPATTASLSSITVVASTILKKIRSFPAGSSGGPDGLTLQHLKDLLGEGSDARLLEALTSVTNIMLAGELSQKINDVLYRGRLLALKKKDGGLRPIVIGYTIRRLAAKCTNKYATEKLAPQLAPIQLGVGIPGGTEAAVHALGGTLKIYQTTTLLDFTNTFNTLRHDGMLKAIWREARKIYNFAYATYNGVPHLQFGDFTILSNEGPQQRDPLSALEFSLTIQPMLVSLTSELKTGIVDNITMAGRKNIVVKDIISIKNKTDMYGLVLNVVKCEVVYGDPLAPHDDDTLKDFQRVELENLTLLGAPVLPGRAIDKAIKQKTEKMEKAISRLTLLQAHDALILLRNGTSVPKLLYTPRMSNCSENPLLVTYDTLQRKCLTDVINIDLNEDQWTQATLSIRDGGLGICNVAMLAPSALLASAISTLQIQNDRHPTGEISWSSRQSTGHGYKLVEEAFRHRRPEDRAAHQTEGVGQSRHEEKLD